jgi:hypothetical protein
MALKRGVLPALLLQFVACNCIYAATEHRAGLIVVEFGKDSRGVAQTQTLVRYHFRGGVLLSKESLLTTSQIRFDLGKNQIIDNRYVVTSWGDVIDLTTGKAAAKGDGELVGIDNKSNSPVIRVDREGEQGTYSFNFDTSRYERLQAPGNWVFPGKRSPDEQLVATGTTTGISLSWPDGRSVSLGNEFLREGTVLCNSFESPTFLWLDDEHLLTQRGNGNIVTVGEDGKVEPLVTIPDVEPLPCGPELWRNNGGQIIYSERRGDWLIDVDRRQAEKLVWESLGNDFEMEHQRNDSLGQSFRFKGTEVGRCPCDVFQASTTSGLIAVEYGHLGSHLGGVSEGVRVWSADSGEWTTIGPAWVAAIVGWVDE